MRWRSAGRAFRRMCQRHTAARLLWAPHLAGHRAVLHSLSKQRSLAGLQRRLLSLHKLRGQLRLRKRVQQHRLLLLAKHGSMHNVALLAAAGPGWRSLGSGYCSEGCCLKCAAGGARDWVESAVVALGEEWGSKCGLIASWRLDGRLKV